MNRSQPQQAVRPRRRAVTTLLLAIFPYLLLAALVSPRAAADTLTLNLKDASIGTLVETIAEITGQNFIVDPRVKGKVTVVSSRPMDKKEIYQVFLSILQVHGFAAVDTGGVIKIVPDVNAKQSSVKTATDQRPGIRDELVTRVLPVRNVSAAQLVPILRPLVPQQGHLAAYGPTNVLIISDRAANIARLVKIVERIDLANKEEVEMVALSHASASEVVRVLNSLLPQSSQVEGAASKLTIVADERTNSILLGGPMQRRLRMRGIIAHLDTPLEDIGNTDVTYLRYAKATDLVPILNGLIENTLTEQSATDAAAGGSISIQADETANALIISAPPDVMREFEVVIRKLDVRRAQVLVEAVIAEMSVAKSAEIGVQFRLGGDDGAFASQSFRGGTPGQSIGDLGQNPLGQASGLALGYISGTVTFAGQEILDIKALLRALRSDVSTNILSTPTLLTLDNQEAEIVVGQNVPFITGQFTNTGANEGATNPFQTIERQDVGITLRVKPQINEGNAVRLDIEQEVSDLSPSTAVLTTSGTASDLITNRRSVKTGVLVDDGEIVILGGLISDNHTETEEKVPFLGDLPVVGRLFRLNSSQKDKRNLMVFIRPVIVRSAETAALVSSEKYNFMRIQQIRERQKGVSMMRGEETAVLPDLTDLVREPESTGDKLPIETP